MVKKSPVYGRDMGGYGGASFAKRFNENLRFRHLLATNTSRMFYLSERQVGRPRMRQRS